MLDRTLWVAISTARAPGHALATALEAHLAFMIELEARGVLFASGPFRAGGENTGDGLTIVRAGTAAEARAILAQDPEPHRRHRRRARAAVLVRARAGRRGARLAR